jgi:hypothetical protein
MQSSFSNPSDTASLPSLSLVVLLGLLFYIEAEPTLVGRAYTHYLDFNAAGTPGFFARGSLLTALQSVFLFTIIAPLLIWITSPRPLERRSLSSLLIRAGVWSWVAGALISTLAHRDDPLVILNAFASVFSGAAVFLAVRKIRFSGIRQLEAAFVVIVLGAGVPALQGLVAMYRESGPPTLNTLFASKTDALLWQNVPFGHPDNVGTLYLVLAAPCLAVVLLGVFSRATRILAALFLFCAIAISVYTMSRASLVVLLLAIAAASIFTRRRAAWIGAAVLLAIVLVGTQIPKLRDYFLPAIQYDTLRDKSAFERVQSIEAGWRIFLRDPLVGVGAEQSSKYIAAGNAHEFAVAEAAEHGILGLAGVILVSLGCLGALLKLVKRGPRTDAACMRFVFLLGPSMYFAKGIAAEAPLNNTVVNTWICTVFAMLAIADSIGSALPSAGSAEPAVEASAAEPLPDSAAIISAW